MQLAGASLTYLTPFLVDQHVDALRELQAQTLQTQKGSSLKLGHGFRMAFREVRIVFSDLTHEPESRSGCFNINPCRFLKISMSVQVF